MFISKELLINTAEKYKVSLDDLAVERFDTYARLLVEWNKVMNLTGITEPDEIVIKHFVDSLTFLTYVDLPEGASLIDVGTGAGFPGLVLAAAYPNTQVTLLDSTGKKLKAVEDIAFNMGVTNIKIVHSRAEEAGKKSEFREQYDFATARAVAELRVLLEYTLPFVKKNGTFLSLKAAIAEEEIHNATNSLKVLGGKIEGVEGFELPGGDKRAIIKVKKISQLSPKYPRPSAQIAKKPL